MGAALLRIWPRADVYDVGRGGGVSSVCEMLLGVFGAVAPVVVCALATAGMVVAVFSTIRTIPASADWERSEA